METRRWQRPKAVLAESAGQSGLFSKSPRRSDPPATSRAAQRENRSSGANARQRATVLEYLEGFPGSTSAELTAKARIKHPEIDRYTFSRRFADLANDGLAVKSGTRLCEVTKRICFVWTQRSKSL